ncbi:sporulation protein YunB [Anaerovorax odorimutans]|uniref:sporulation protein YunB n=1 Tax=Anaerovorax odorimutans TaxID=109327 RepID=UPI000484F990|nr:sporulation protein YunB [Anaerovorax odorimutans]
MKTYRGNKKKNKIKWFFSLVLLIILTMYGFLFVDKVIKPTIASISEVKVKSIITQTINDSIQEEFILDTDIRQLLDMKTDNDGNVTFVEANASAMNELAAGLATAAQTKFKNMEPQDIRIPVGSLIGSQILSQMGPNVNLKVLPIGMSKANFRTEFESCGINQTKYKVFLEFESQAKVLVPFSMNNINVNNTILVAEAIIVGRVPDTYVKVPEDKIMDAIN